MNRRVGVQSMVDPSQQRANATGQPVPVGWGPAPFQPSQPRGADPTRRIILPGCNYPPADAIPVDQIGEADIAFGASAVLNTIQVPGTLTLRIAGIGFSADDESGLRFLTWSLFATPPASTITPYVNMPGAIGTIQQLSWVFVIAGSTVLITLVATNTSPVASTYHYISRVQGWFYNELEVR